MKDNRITLRSFVAGIVISAVFAALTCYVENRQNICITSTQIPVLPFLLLILTVLVFNPLLRLIRIVRVFSVIEIMIVFVMGLVSSSVSTFGLVSQVTPIISSLFNQEWNTRQSEWELYVTPFMNEAYFVSEPGIQEASHNYRQALLQSQQLESDYNTAAYFQKCATRAAKLADDLKRIETDASLTGKRRSTRISSAKGLLADALATAQDAEQIWLQVAGANKLPSLDEVLKTYPELIAQQEIREALARDTLNQLEQVAFDKVETFRRGLPKEKSAFPRILPMPEDTFDSYIRRWNRLARGMAAMRSLKAARGTAAEAGGQALTTQQVSRVSALLQQAENDLGPLSALRVLEEKRGALQAESAAFVEECIRLEQRLKKLHTDKRKASGNEIRVMAAEIDDVARTLKQTNARQHEFKVIIERHNEELSCAVSIGQINNALAAIRQEMQDHNAGPPVGDEIEAAIDKILPAFASMDMTLRRFFVGEVPWSLWIRPLAYWAALVTFTFIMLMSLNILLFRQWAYNEKLTYPLAELPKALVGGLNAGEGLPPIFKNSFFWFGAAISGSIMGWNVFCGTNIVPGLQPFVMRQWWNAYTQSTPFAVIGNNTFSEIFFTMIGLSFLIPKNISFSLWFFFILSRFQMLLITWAGHEASFPTDWWCLLNFATAEGLGALLVFSIVVLFKCRKYLLCAFLPGNIAELESGERKELKLASLAFIGCSIAIIAQLWLGLGANFFYTVYFYLFVVLLTIAMVRAVTEGGLLAVKTYVSPFHIVRAFFGLDHKWTSVSLAAPLILYYAVFFMDIKAFIAPAMANAIKLRDDFRMKRAVFHMAIAGAILIAAVTAVVTAIMLAYSSGADAMNLWFYTNLPRGTVFETIRRLIVDAPASSPKATVWIGVGAGAMALLLYLRQFIFWLPHPLGMVMLVNPTIPYYWFSLMLGWMANVLVTKYGNKDTYHRARYFFIGLIVGELLIVAVSMFLSLTMNLSIKVDLNRN